MPDPLQLARQYLAAGVAGRPGTELAGVRSGENGVHASTADPQDSGDPVARAIEHLRWQLQRDPDRLEARLMLANLLARTDPGLALDHFNQAAERLLATRNAAAFERFLTLLQGAPAVAVDRLQARLHGLISDAAPGPERTRFETFVDALFDPSRIQPLRRQTLQKPSFLFYPGIEQRPWFPAARFALPAGIDFAKLREEALALIATRPAEPYFQSHLTMEGELETLRNDSHWSALSIRAPQGYRVDLSPYPVLRQYVEQLPLAECPSHAPEVILSILQPGTRIPPHHGLSNFKLAHHLPIQVPPGDLGIRVGQETRHWREGEPVFFDDSFEHEAWNRGEEVRVVLIADVWHPDLSRQERQWLTAAIAECDRWLALPINRFFQYRLDYMTT